MGRMVPACERPQHSGGGGRAPGSVLSKGSDSDPSGARLPRGWAEAKTSDQDSAGTLPCPAAPPS